MHIYWTVDAAVVHALCAFGGAKEPTQEWSGGPCQFTWVKPNIDNDKVDTNFGSIFFNGVIAIMSGCWTSDGVMQCDLCKVNVLGLVEAFHTAGKLEESILFIQHALCQ